MKTHQNRQYFPLCQTSSKGVGKEIYFVSQNYYKTKNHLSKLSALAQKSSGKYVMKKMELSMPSLHSSSPLRKILHQVAIYFAVAVHTPNNTSSICRTMCLRKPWEGGDLQRIRLKTTTRTD